jgi:Tol biopolymer transport system component
MNTRIIRVILISLLTAATERVCAQSDSHGVQSFVPGIISSDSLEFNAAFSPDGKSFYFTRSVNKRTQLHYSTRTKNGWSIPVPLPFSNTNYSDADPAFSPAGELYFISNRPLDLHDTTRDYNIWIVTSVKLGQWSQPINVKALNSPEDEYYISFTQKGDACFSSSRKGGYGEEDIYFSEYRNEEFLEPRNMGSTINTSQSEYDPFITANGSALIFTSAGRGINFGKADLYWSVRTVKGWQEASHFNETINTDTRDYCPYISPDKKYIFYSSRGDIKFTDISILPAILINSITKR